MVATAQDGLTLTVPLASDPLYVGKLAYGIVNWNGIFSLIEIHAGTSITLVVAIQGLGQAIIDDGPQDILVAVGCNRSHPRCVELENWLNFGGFHHMPDRNPFNSSIE